jgi:protein-S-isoprenylcysteine O-methyltransferase Ste14
MFYRFIIRTALKISINILLDHVSRKGCPMTEKTKVMTPQTILMLLIFIVLSPMLPLIISWQWDWWEAWVYAGINIFGFAISRYLAGRRHPDLLAERAKFLQHQNPEKWDKILSPLLGLGGGLIPVVAGLDARFGPSAQFGLGVKIVSILVIVLGFVIGSYALMVNRFFSGMVRIQSERGHHVVEKGPYRWVRHPGYAGSLLTYPVIPLLLDSMWAFIPAFTTIFIIILRTKLEDQALQEKLEGYREYAQRVRYRLIPGVW